MTTLKKISDLSAVTALDGTEIFELTQAGVSKRGTIAEIATSPNTPFSTATVASLKALPVGIRPLFVVLSGYYNAGDGGGGLLWRDSSSVTTADDGLTFQCTADTTGRYKRIVGGVISPLMFGIGMAVGAPTNSSVQFQRAIDTGYAIDIAKCALSIAGITVGANDCPRIFSSDGTGSITYAPTSTTATVLINATKAGDFWIDNVTFIGDVSTNPTIAPVPNMMVRYAATSATSNLRITNNRSTGARFFLSVTNNFATSGIFVDNNYVTGTWSEAISFSTAPSGLTVTNNTIEDGGYGTGAGEASGAIRVGLLGQDFAEKQISICNNRIARFSVGSGQDVIDVATSGAFNVNISINSILDCGGGIELKSNLTAADDFDVYRGFSVNGNIIRMVTDPSGSTAGNSVGINMHNSGAGLARAGKMSQFSVNGNHIYCDTLAAAGVTAIFVGHFTHVDIKNNFISKVSRGIEVDGESLADGPYYISGNTIDVNGSFGITNTAGAILSGLYITNNPLIKSRGTAGIIISGSGVNDVQIVNNGKIWGVPTYGIDIRAVTSCLIAGNTIAGGINAIRTVTGPILDLKIEKNNKLWATWDAKPVTSVTVTGNGTGLTNGTRVFTFTDGAFTAPCAIAVTVASSAITGTATILEAGSYSSFTTGATFGVDTGTWVSTPSFTILGPTATTACDIGAATTCSATILNNGVNVSTTNRTVSGLGSFTAGNNTRGILAATPTWGGALGDMVLHSTATVFGWRCTTAGVGTAAAWTSMS